MDVINKIKNRPDDRRIIMCAWNPADLNKMALPPCHCLVQFYVANGKFSLFTRFWYEFYLCRILYLHLTFNAAESLQVLRGKTTLHQMLLMAQNLKWHFRLIFNKWQNFLSFFYPIIL